MDLVDQLNHLKARKGATRGSDRSGQTPQGHLQAPEPDALAKLLEGAELVERGDSRLLIRTVHRPLHSKSIFITSLLRWIFRQDIEPTEVVVIDTETTGLAGGSGTVAFMVGLAHLTETGIVVEQAFMPDYPDEGALLVWVAERLKSFRAMISYNGKSFDLPLLRTRWRMQGSREEQALPHFDLLPVARRIFAHRLQTCSLSNIERHVLDRWREADLPGRSAPRAYFRYLEGHELETMAAVFEHNEIDVVSTAELLARVSSFYAKPQTEDFGEQSDWLGLGEWAEQIGDLERAREVLTLALATMGETPLRTKIELRVADLCRRANRHDEALDLWQAVARRDPMAGWPAVKELVQWHAEQSRWSEAYRLLESAWERFEQARGLRSQRGEWRLPTAWRQWMADCEKLLHRLRQASQEEQLTLPM